MKNTISVLLFVLLTTIFCSNADNLRKLDSAASSISPSPSYINDCMTCTSVENASPSSCSAMNSQLTTTGALENQCCYFEYTLDYKYMLILALGKDYAESTEESYQDFKVCVNVLKDQVKTDTDLYSISTITKTKEIKYNCGNKDVIFKASEYKPTTTEGKIGKEAADCKVIIEKDKCLSASKNYETDVQCCWFSLINDEANEDDSTVSTCFGVQQVSKEYFYNVESQMTKIKNYAQQYGENYTFTCSDKNGKKVTGTYNYKVDGGNLKIETNEQSYSNFIGLTTFSILLITLLL